MSQEQWASEVLGLSPESLDESGVMSVDKYCNMNIPCVYVLCCTCLSHSLLKILLNATESYTWVLFKGSVCSHDLSLSNKCSSLLELLTSVLVIQNNPQTTL